MSDMKTGPTVRLYSRGSLWENIGTSDIPILIETIMAVFSGLIMSLKGIPRWKLMFVAGVVTIPVLFFAAQLVFVSRYTDPFRMAFGIRSRFSGDVDVASPDISDRECERLVPSIDPESDMSLAILEAIGTCRESGGGTVRLAAGEWSVGPIRLESGIRLYLEEGAEVHALSPERWDFSGPVFNRFEGIETMGPPPMIYAEDCRDVALAGEGALYGRGEEWQSLDFMRLREVTLFDRLYPLAKTDISVDKRVFPSDEASFRPDLVLFSRCSRVLVEGVSIYDSPRWNLHFLYSRDISVRNVSIDSEGVNTDGIVLDSSSNALVEQAFVSSGDDAIALKSGLDDEGRRRGIPTENIVIRNSAIRKAHGGIVIGSEVSGGIRNVLAENISVERADSAARIKAPRGRGGYVERIVMRDFSFDELSDSPIRIDMEYIYNVRETGLDESIPEVGNLSFSGFHGKNVDKAVNVEGLSENPIDGLFIEGLDVKCDRGIFLKNVKNVFVRNSNIDIRFGSNKGKKRTFIIENGDGILTDSVFRNDPLSKNYVECVDGSVCRGLFMTAEKRLHSLEGVSGDGFILGPRRVFSPTLRLLFPR